VTRAIDSDVITALALDSIRMANLVVIGFNTTIRLTDYFHDLTHGGNTYSASSHLLEIGSPAESKQLQVNSLNIKLSGVEQSYIAILLGQNWTNKSLIIYRAVIDEDGAIIGSPINMFQGLITQFEISEDETSVDVDIEAASHWADFERTAGRITNDNRQKQFFSADDGMNFAAKIVKDIRWGKG
jgi:hypothetical protein